MKLIKSISFSVKGDKTTILFFLFYYFYTILYYFYLLLQKSNVIESISRLITRKNYGEQMNVEYL